MMAEPLKFSVLMSVYAGDKPAYMEDSLQSLANQTVKADEVIIVEDGPLMSGVADVIERFRPILRIQSVRLEENRGLAHALNEGLKRCSFPYVARMDADDRCLPDRFEKQAAFLQENPRIDVCSGWVEERNEEMNKTLNMRLLPLHDSDIKSFARRRNPVNHSAVMYRKSAVLDAGGYPGIYPEDYPLWCRMIMNGCTFANIPGVLVYMRTGEDFYSRRGLQFLKGEFRVLMYQREIGFIGWPDVVKNGFIRALVRLSPRFARKWFYRNFRGRGNVKGT